MYNVGLAQVHGRSWGRAASGRPVRVRYSSQRVFAT